MVLGCDIHGRKHLLALDAGFRESAESWKAVLLSLRDRGVKGAKVAVGDGALGFWAALAKVKFVDGIDKREITRNAA